MRYGSPRSFLALENSGADQAFADDAVQCFRRTCLVSRALHGECRSISVQPGLTPVNSGDTPVHDTPSWHIGEPAPLPTQLDRTHRRPRPEPERRRGRGTTHHPPRAGTAAGQPRRCRWPARRGRRGRHLRGGHRRRTRPPGPPTRRRRARPARRPSHRARATSAPVDADLPAAYPCRVYTDPDSLVGSVTLGPVQHGELVQAGAVHAPGARCGPPRALLPPRGGAGRSAATSQPGEHVDLYATYDTDGEPVTRLVVADAEVRAVEGVGRRWARRRRDGRPDAGGAGPRRGARRHQCRPRWRRERGAHHRHRRRRRAHRVPGR